MEVDGKVIEDRGHRKVRGEHRRIFNGRYSVRVVTVRCVCALRFLRFLFMPSCIQFELSCNSGPADVCRNDGIK